MKLSIITINYNNQEGLRRTIESVVSQTCKDFEYIVIDGASTDGSMDVIKEFSDSISYWVSEPDGGIYPAMNKGVRSAHGDYCIFMNSGDLFYSNHVIEDFFSSNPIEDIVCGDLDYGKKVICPSPDTVTAKHLYRTTMYHQASFIKRDMLIKIPYDEKMKVSGDWKFFFDALIIHNCSYRHIPITVAVFEIGGYSSHNLGIARAEKDDVLKSCFPERVLNDFYNYTYGETNYTYMMNKISEIPPIKRIIYRINRLVLKILNLRFKSEWIVNLSSNPDGTYIAQSN